MDAIRELGAARAAVLDAIRETGMTRARERELSAAYARTQRRGTESGVIREPAGGGYRVVRNVRINRVA